jgi:hypothetical protein
VAAGADEVLAAVAEDRQRVQRLDVRLTGRSQPPAGLLPVLADVLRLDGSHKGQALHAGAEPATSKGRAADVAANAKAAPNSATGARVSTHAAPVAPAEGSRRANPRRVAAGKRNRAKRQGETAAGAACFSTMSSGLKTSRFAEKPIV